MIAQAVEQIRNTVSLSVLDESATKQGVVLRLLSLAGWDTFDVSQVVPEYTVGSRRVDYALGPGSPNAVFIEVKRPGENLERHQQQLLEYCFQEGVKLAVLTNGRTWWLYLPLQAGSWQQRRFLTIDLEVQEPSVVERRFLEYLSPERVGSGQAVGDAEDLVESQQRAEIIAKTITAAWTQIVETPDELLVDLISETTERICGFKPEPELVKQFLAGRAHAANDALDGSPSLVLSQETNAPSAKQTRRDGFAGAYWCRPELYLDPSVRAGISSLAQLPPEVAERCVQWLRQDLASGKWDALPVTATCENSRNSTLGTGC